MRLWKIVGQVRKLINDILENADYILRGYEDIVEKLTKVGANIKLEKCE